MPHHPVDVVVAVGVGDGDVDAVEAPRVHWEDGVVYAEVRYAPEQHLQRGLTLEQVVEAVTEGFREGAEEAAAAGRPIVVRQLLTAMRHAAKSTEIAQLAVRYRDRGPDPVTVIVVVIVIA